MATPQTQVNVRLSADELELLDELRRSAVGAVSRADVLRSLLREKRRAILDKRIADAYDAASWHDDALGEASARAAGEALDGL